jgi:hypothetical protein
MKSKDRETKNCVYCGEKAEVWTGHVIKGDEIIGAGWCQECLYDKGKIAGFVGHYKKKFGKVKVKY